MAIMNVTPATDSTTRSAPAIPSLPGRVPVLGVLPRFQKDPLGMLTEASFAYSPVVRLELAVVDGYLVTDPKWVEHVLVTNVRNYAKRTRGYQMLRLVLGNGLLTSEGEFWKRQRRIIQPAFHRERISAFGEIMTAAANQMVDRWKVGTPFDVSSELMKVTLKVVGETLLSTDVTSSASEVGSAMNVVLKHLIERTLHPFGFPEWVPTPSNRQFNRAKAKLDEVVGTMIAARRKGEGPKNDLLSMLMEATDPETGERMSDEQLRDEVMTLFLAGHETTANSLTWTTMLLGKTPHVEQRLLRELNDVLGDRIPTLSDLPKLQYTSMVIKEAMRLYPPVWTFSRWIVEDDVIDGLTLPKDTIVLVCPYALHRHPKYWKDPDVFDPERWAPDAPAPAKGTYFPFSMGQRKCIGDTFAMMEAQLILATILQRVRLSLVPGQSFEVEPLITLRAKHGVNVVVTPRVQSKN